MKYEKKVILARKIASELSEQGCTISDAKDILQITQKIVDQSFVSSDCVKKFKDWI